MGGWSQNKCCRVVIFCISSFIHTWIVNHSPQVWGSRSASAIAAKEIVCKNLFLCVFEVSHLFWMQAFPNYDISWCRCLLTIAKWCIRQKKGSEGVFSFFPFHNRKLYPLPSLWYHSLLGLQNFLLEHLLVSLWVFVWVICVVSRLPHTFSRLLLS